MYNDLQQLPIYSDENMFSLFLCLFGIAIVIREDWLWKKTNIKYKNNSATV